MLEFILHAFFLGCISWVYHCVLREKFLSKWFFWGWKKFDNLQHDRPWYISIWYEPIFNCEKCFAGQMALWRFFFWDSYSLYYHIIFIALTILSVTLIAKWTN